MRIIFNWLMRLRFQALAPLLLMVGWTVPLLADDLAPLVVKGSIGGPGVSATGANQYSVGAQDISNLPLGENTSITDVLTQMPGVAIDQNQQIHIRNTEGPQFQYQITGSWSRWTSTPILRSSR